VLLIGGKPERGGEFVKTKEKVSPKGRTQPGKGREKGKKGTPKPPFSFVAKKKKKGTRNKEKSQYARGGGEKSMAGQQRQKLGTFGSKSTKRGLFQTATEGGPAHKGTRAVRIAGWNPITSAGWPKRGGGRLLRNRWKNHPCGKKGKTRRRVNR